MDHFTDLQGLILEVCILFDGKVLKEHSIKYEANSI